MSTPICINPVYSMLQMHAIQMPGGSIIPDTLNADANLSIQFFIDTNSASTWHEAEAKGYKCVPLNIYWAIPDVPKLHHEVNPDYVIVTCEEQCRIHGWALNEPIATMRRKVELPDKKGYDIYVHSIKYNRSVKLGSKEYELIGDKQTKQTAAE